MYKKPYRKRSVKKSSKAPLSNAQFNAVKKIANKSINRRAEKKYFLVNVEGGTRDYAGSVTDLSGISQGDTDTSRDGDSLYIRSIRLKGYVTIADTTNIMRVIVFQWLDDTTPVTSDILSGTYAGSTSYVVAPYSHDQRRKFRILYDKTMYLNGNRPQTSFTTKYIKPPVKKVAYTGASTAGSNKIWVAILSDSAAATHPSATFVSKLTFNDM